MATNIQFGILANINITNDHYLQEFDRVQRHMQKIDIYNYLKPFERMGYSSVEDMIEDGVKGFEDDAKWISGFDGFGDKSRFYVVCYLTDKDGNHVGMEKIREIFY